jgi:hypothetical protein
VREEEMKTLTAWFLVASIQAHGAEYVCDGYWAQPSNLSIWTYVVDEQVVKDSPDWTKENPPVSARGAHLLARVELDRVLGKDHQMQIESITLKNLTVSNQKKGMRKWYWVVEFEPKPPFAAAGGIPDCKIPVLFDGKVPKPTKSSHDDP